MAGMRLTMRDLLWTILVAAICLAWFRSDQQRAEEVGEYRRLLAGWRQATTDLLVRSGLAVVHTEPCDDPEIRKYGFRQLTPQSVKNSEWYDEIRSLGLELTEKAAPAEEL